jgi:hypothetical protein
LCRWIFLYVPFHWGMLFILEEFRTHACNTYCKFDSNLIITSSLQTICAYHIKFWIMWSWSWTFGWDIAVFLMSKKQ